LKNKEGTGRKYMAHYVVQIIDNLPDVSVCSYREWQDVVKCVVSHIVVKGDTQRGKLVIHNMIKVREQMEKYGVGLLDSQSVAGWDFPHSITVTDTQFHFPETDPPNYDCAEDEYAEVNSRYFEAVCIEEITD
jgi:hypothetical protein